VFVVLQEEQVGLSVEGEEGEEQSAGGEASELACSGQACGPRDGRKHQEGRMPFEGIHS